MVTAMILMNVERKEVNNVAEQLAGMEGISEAYSVSGHYDLAAMVRVKTNDELADLVTKKLAAIPAILRTETLLAFRAYSRHDLEAMFDIAD
ncbi:MAG: Lrp/AsnC ligand binding domain-containing protein [Phycisphaerae bacterium]|nr:Lrp/AsnC ligand binding domain-containing protein [Phycisphaerae bacterium]